MTASRMVVCLMCLSVLWLWLPSGAKAVTCQAIGNDIWLQWGQGKLPQNDATIDKVLKVKNDCPQLAGSLDRIANDIKAAREKIAEAVDIVKEAVQQVTKNPASPGQEVN